MSEFLINRISNPDLLEAENLRLKELNARYESLSEEERAELMGLNAFPDNPRGAELRKKEALGKISEKEEEELIGLTRLKLRQKKFSVSIQRLWERTEQNDPNVEQVRMDEGKSIEVLPTGEEKVIWTYGIRGCNSCVIFTEYLDGTRNCILTHYSPTDLSKNMAKLGELIKASEKMGTAKVKRAVIVSRGDFVQDPTTKKWAMKTVAQREVDMLALAITADLGEDTEIKIENYCEANSVERKDEGILAVYIPPKGKDVVYQSENGGGKLSESQGTK